MKLNTIVRLVTAVTVATSLGQVSPASAHARTTTAPASVAATVEDLTPLDPPSAPTVSDLTATSATLNWTSGGGPVRRLRVFQLVDGTWHAYGPLLGPATASLQVTGLHPGTLHTFAVQAYAMPNSGYGDSPLSEPGTFTTPPAAID